MNKTPLYENVAHKIIGLVDEGTFNPGDRVPSIRALSHQLKVSINTIKMAYGFLEDHRIIEARPQSGYYVCPRLTAIPREPEPENSGFRLHPSEITSSELVMQVMGDVMNPKLIQFGAAIPDPELIPVTRINRILASECRRFPDESTGYSMPPGNKRLRTQLARFMMRSGCTLSPDEIIITNGATEAVFLALRTLCSPGDTLAVGTPFYFNFLQLIKSLDLKVLEIPMSPVDGINIKALETALKQHSVQACLIISNFNNPLGNCMADRAKKRVLQLLKSHNVPLIEDDINGDLSFSARRPSVIKSWDSDGDALLCSSFSKTLAPGYRIGWIAPGRYFDAVKRQKLVTNIATPAPTQLAMAEFLVSGGYEHHLRTIRKAYAKKVMQMADAVGQYFPEGTRVTRPEGGFTLWIELPQGTDSLELYGMAHKKGISIAPGAIFSTTDLFRHCIRLNAALWSDSTKWAVKELGKMACDIQ
ncbi:Helix-turn-helix transcriptional regulator with aminotransferase domain, GntR family [Desulfamplus magnetovallimortis]|uniref:Helix-turn-helix transcriptional regulator with aminotransferase domain, GntR family n=1 Tax=Desulfamplus magnetovallimortis TaxID=1246637 RepID=A0A1W1H8J7_9BACT|nr:PLP-dependent aminotransferase family protein [Desulfamplus magnetovallimortis]SLM28754.1 Helix-turn-helix transcriptional regulator with aminotransferase domain, GntR family [Desulfamplus magnetovallimortis]